MSSPAVRRFLQVLANRGLLGTLEFAWSGIVRRVRRRSSGESAPQDAPVRASPQAHPFDLEHGTDTGGLIWGENLPSGNSSDLWSTAYYGIAPSLFDRVMTSVDLDWTRFTFIDLGSGKGRALLLASRLPFQRIIGVELSPQLSEIASANIRTFSAPWQQCRDIESRNGDATTAEYPEGPFVLYLFNPFHSPVMKRCLRNLSHSLASRPREAWLIYVNPCFEPLIEKHARGFQKQWDRDVALAVDDEAADHFGSSQERVIVYRYHQPT